MLASRPCEPRRNWSPALSGATKADLAKLYELHAGELHGYLYRRAGQAGADLLGEVFVIALQRLADLPEPQLRRAWLFGTARRLLLAQHRTVARRSRAEDERARLLESSLEGTESDTGTRARAVHEALASLAETDRELIRLTEWEQLQTAEAAAVLGMRPGTARMRLLRARRALALHEALRALPGAHTNSVAVDR
ncbi:RNA polymerase sigma factor [Nocardioides jiangxiensis]|uniref:RNA polymerase sigma factor n=1 Tax=Nocardioides jiangxiensis TaxID=3064524 RepID=UPI0034E1BF93